MLHKVRKGAPITDNSNVGILRASNLYTKMSDEFRNNREGSSYEDTDAGSFNFDIEELDDAEYQIPPVVEPPTLESILSEPDDVISINEDSDSLNWSQGLHSSPGVGIEGGSETTSIASRKSKTSSEKRETSSSSAFLRYVLLKGISTQIAAAEKVNGGYATAITVTTMVAVGTSRGVILVFDRKQTLSWYLNSPDDDQGSVSSLCFNCDSTRLLVGFARGHILMYDLTNGKLIRTLIDVHPPGTAVLSVKFTDSPTVALCSDSGGSVFELQFKRTLGVRGCNSKCLFSGSRGEVCVIQPLLLNQLLSHPLQGVILVAMATLSKVIVIVIRPKMRVVLVRALPPGSTVLPLVTWQFLDILVAGKGKVLDPVLAYAKDNSIHFFQISVDSESKLRVAALQKLVVNYSLLSLHWMNAWTIAAIDISERLHLVDVHSLEELENVDISTIGLVYESSNFKGILTGGNVSRAMALAGEKACYNTVVSHGNQMLVLGSKTVHVLSIRPWFERLNYLVKQKKYLAALSLGLSFYEEPKAELRGSKGKRKEIAKAKVVEILEQFIDDMENPMDDISAVMQYAVSVHYVDIIFNKLWEHVYIDPNMKGIYLESLEPFILNDQIVSIPPAILQQFVVAFETTGKLQALEACIIHLDITSLDLHQVVQVCWAHGLYDAIIHVHNKAFNDYVTPIHELVPILQKALSSGRKLTAKEVELGNKLLVYVSCCLAGRGYPIGDIPKDSVHQVKYEIFKCLTNLHSKDAHDSELPYPYLRTLIHFDPAAFLNVVSLAFTEPEFTSELGLRQRQRLIDILLSIMVHNPGYTLAEIGALYTFLARQLSRPPSSLHVDRELLDKIFDYLTLPHWDHQEERQQALLDLLRADALQEYSKDVILAAAAKAKFFRVCEAIHEQNGEWDKVFLCYLQDSLRKPQVFSFLRNIFVLYKNTKDIEPIADILSQKIGELMELDFEKTLAIVAVHALDKLPLLLDNLAGNDAMQLALLRSLLYSDARKPPCENVSGRLREYFGKYMELVMRLEPKCAVQVLKTHSDLYEVEEGLSLARKCGHEEAQALLLEKKKSYEEAFEVLHRKLEKCLKGAAEEREEVDGLVTELIGIIQRCELSCSEEAKQKLWVALLDVLITCENCLDGTEKTRLIAKVLSGTMGHANPSAILEHLFHTTNSLATFGQIRHLLTAMLDNTSFEERIVRTTQKLLCSDLHTQLVASLDGAKRGVRLSTFLCSACNKTLATSPVLVFFCGHPLHKACFTENQCPVCETIALDKMSCARNSVAKRGSSWNLMASGDFKLKVGAPPAPDLENLERDENVLNFK